MFLCMHVHMHMLLTDTKTGKDCTYVNWGSRESMHKFSEDSYEMNRPYEGVSMMVMAFKNVEDAEPWPSPILFHDAGICFVFQACGSMATNDISL